MTDAPRDIERVYATKDVVAKLRRLADALETGEPFRIQIGGQRVRVPARAQFSVEHERDEEQEEIEFQLKWALAEVPPSGTDEEMSVDL
jgi:amphi-Trp domain-containing protein